MTTYSKYEDGRFASNDSGFLDHIRFLKLGLQLAFFGDISIFVRLRFTPLVIDVVAIMFVARGVGGKDVDHHNLHLSSPLRCA